MKRPHGVKVAYSPTETKLLKILLSRKKPISSIELCELLYTGEQRPWHAQAGINTTLRSLIRKVSFNHEEYVIERTERRGPYPIEFRVRPAGKKNLAVL